MKKNNKNEKLEECKVVDTLLPKFPGFFDSIFCVSKAMEYKKNATNEMRESLGLCKFSNTDNFDFDYVGYYEDVLNRCIPFIENFLKINFGIKKIEPDFEKFRKDPNVLEGARVRMHLSESALQRIHDQYMYHFGEPSTDLNNLYLVLSKLIDVLGIWNQENFEKAVLEEPLNIGVFNEKNLLSDVIPDGWVVYLTWPESVRVSSGLNLRNTTCQFFSKEADAYDAYSNEEKKDRYGNYVRPIRSWVEPMWLESYGV